MVGVSHELLSNSLSNFLCSFFNSSPVAAAFSRSAVSSICQVQTPLSNVYAGKLDRIRNFFASIIVSPSYVQNLS